MEQCSFNRSILLQWHITPRCNQRCTHCYQEQYSGKELSFLEIQEVIEQYKNLLKIYSEKNNIKNPKGHINITGGEPFSRADFFEILEEFKKNRKYFTYGILTNGSYITEEVAERLKELKVGFVQVSIEGDQITHDAIRGNGNFEMTLNAIKIMKNAGIKTMVSFTAHKGNYQSFSIVARYARKAGTSKLWTDRLVPIGNGKDMEYNCLSSKEMMEFFEIVKKEQDKRLINKFYKINISMDRALQFLKTGNHPYSCSAGKSLITVLENGDVVPCRRMPLISGNVLETSMDKIYFNSDIFKELRNERKPEKGCTTCPYFNKCQGGSRCISYATFNNLNEPDPACPIANK